MLDHKNLDIPPFPLNILPIPSLNFPFSSPYLEPYEKAT